MSIVKKMVTCLFLARVIVFIHDCNIRVWAHFTSTCMQVTCVCMGSYIGNAGLSIVTGSLDPGRLLPISHVQSCPHCSTPHTHITRHIILGSVFMAVTNVSYITESHFSVHTENYGRFDFVVQGGRDAMFKRKKPQV